MAYVIESKFTDKAGREYNSYFKRETMFGVGNVMAGLDEAQRFEFISDARRVKRQRFSGRSNAKIIKIEE